MHRCSIKLYWAYLVASKALCLWGAKVVGTVNWERGLSRGGVYRHFVKLLSTWVSSDAIWWHKSVQISSYKFCFTSCKFYAHFFSSPLDGAMASFAASTPAPHFIIGSTSEVGLILYFCHVWTCLYCFLPQIIWSVFDVWLISYSNLVYWFGWKFWHILRGFYEPF